MGRQTGVCVRRIVRVASAVSEKLDMRLRLRRVRSVRSIRPGEDMLEPPSFHFTFRLLVRLHRSSMRLQVIVSGEGGVRGDEKGDV